MSVEFLPHDDGNPFDTEELPPRESRRRLSARGRAVVAALVAVVALGAAGWWLVDRTAGSDAVPITVVGRDLAEPSGVLAAAERQFDAWTAGNHGRTTGSASCWFVRGGTTSDIDSDLLCGPVLLPNGERRKPYLDYRFDTFDDESGLHAVVSDQPLQREPVAASPGTTLVRPDRTAAPLRDAGFAPPPAPASTPFALVQIDDLQATMRTMPTRASMGGEGVWVRLLRAGPATSYGAGPDERVAPKGRQLLAFELEFRPGEHSFAMSSVDFAVDVHGEPRPRPLHLDFDNLTESGQTFVAAVPSSADVELLATEHGITQRLSLRTGAVGPHNITMLRDGPRRDLRAVAHGTTTATIDNGGTFTADLDVTVGGGERYFYLPASLQHPAPGSMYLFLDVEFRSSDFRDSATSHSFRTTDVTVTPPGGEPVYARTLDRSDTPYFLVPGDLTDATVTITGEESSGDGFRMSIDTPLAMHVHLTPTH